MINWLASYPKSGNTWVRLFLSAYRIGVCSINDNIGTTMGDSLPNYYNAVFPIDKLNSDGVWLLRNAALLHTAYGALSMPRIFKTHCANVMKLGVHAIPKSLTFNSVYLIRDPRDVCVSYARHLHKHIDETIFCMDNMGFESLRDDKIPSPLTTWSNHVLSWEKLNPTIVRYEDLKNNPIEVFPKILSTYGIKVEKNKVKKAIRLCEIEKLKAQEAKEGFMEIGKQDKFFGQGKGWINELTEKQIRRLEEDHLEVMKKYDYQLSKFKDRAKLRSVG